MEANAPEPEPEPAPSTPPPVTPSVSSTSGGFWRNFWKLAVGAILAVGVFALLVTLSLAQFASRDVSLKVLRRAVATLTEVDLFLADNESEIRGLAAESPDQDIALPDYPVQVSLTATEAALPLPELREVVLDRSAEKVYEEGMSAFEEEGRTTDIGLFSPAGAVRYSLGVLEDDSFDSLSVAAAVLAGFALMAALVLVLLTRGYGRLAALGAAVSFGALPFLVLAVTARFALRLASEDEGDYMVARLLGLGQDMAWLPIRNGIALSGLGLAFLLLGASVAWWADHGPFIRWRPFR
jgi:hypothetical protein